MSLQASQHTCRSEQNLQESTPSCHDGFQGSSSNKHAFMSRVPTLTTPFLGTCFILPVCLCMYRVMCVQTYVCLYVCLRGGIDISFWCLLQSLSTLIFSQNLKLCSSAVCLECSDHRHPPKPHYTASYKGAGNLNQVCVASFFPD